MFNNFFYKSFTFKQELILRLIFHLTENQLARSIGIGKFGMTTLTNAGCILFSWSANIDFNDNECKFCLY